MVEFGSAWSYISEDWGRTFKFMALAALLTLIPVVGALVLMGLSVKIVSNSINKKSEIPEVFDGFGDNLLVGLKLALFDVIVGFAAALIISLFLGGSIMQLSVAAMSNSEDALANAIMGMMGSIIPIFLVVLFFALIIPPLFCNFAKEKRFSAFFEFGKCFNLVFKDLGNYVKTILVVIVYSIGLSIISGILTATFIGLLLVAPLYSLIYSWIIGEWFREASK